MNDKYRLFSINKKQSKIANEDEKMPIKQIEWLKYDLTKIL